MKFRMLSLFMTLCLLCALTACGGGDAASNASSEASQAVSETSQAASESSAAAGGEALTEEAYQSQVEALSADISEAMTAMTALSAATDEDSMRAGVESVRAMAQAFRDFAALENPPEGWAEAHAKVVEGCTLFADALEGMCDNAIGVLDGTVDEAAYTEAVTGFTTDLTDAAALLTEGFGMMES